MVFVESCLSSTNASSSQEIFVKNAQQKLCQEKPKLEYYTKICQTISKIWMEAFAQVDGRVYVSA